METVDGPTIAAIVYRGGSDPGSVLRIIVSEFASRGLKCAGFIQRNIERPGRARCDMVLENVASGSAIPISADRGPGARGCRLDESELARAMMEAMSALAADTDLLLINKFGKSEAEGRGFRPLIAAALERDIPVLIAVPWSNIESWRHFSGDLAYEIAIEALPEEMDGLRLRLGLDLPPASIGADSAASPRSHDCEQRPVCRTRAVGIGCLD